MPENHFKASKPFAFLILAGLHNVLVLKLLKLFHTFHETAILLVSSQIKLLDTIPVEGDICSPLPFVVKAMQTPLNTPQAGTQGVWKGKKRVDG